MQRTSSSAPGHQACTPETAKVAENQLEARQAPQYQQSGSAPPPRLNVTTRDDVRFARFLEHEAQHSESRFRAYVQDLMVSQQQGMDRFTRLLDAMDEDREIDPRSRTDIRPLINPQLPGFQVPTFELSPDALASVRVLLSQDAEALGQAPTSSTASTAASSNQPAADQDGSPV